MKIRFLKKFIFTKVFLTDSTYFYWDSLVHFDMCIKTITTTYSTYEETDTWRSLEA